MNLKFSRTKLAFILSLPIIIWLWLSSSFSEIGPDYQNYIWMIERIQSSDSFLAKVLIAKDILFGFIVWLIDPNNRDEYSSVFLCVLAVGSLYRLFLSQKMGFNIFIYLFIYYFLLAPGLDYSAIRSLMGLSLITIYLCTNRFKLLFFILAFFSHSSMIVTVFIFSSTFEKLVKILGTIKVCFILYVTSLGFIQLLYLLPQTETYISFEGSWLLFFRTFVLLFTLIILYIELMKNALDPFVLKLIRGSLFLCVISLGCINVSIASARIMEMSAFFSLIALFSMKSDTLKRPSIIFCYLLVLLVIVANFVYRNFRSELWYLVLN